MSELLFLRMPQKIDCKKFVGTCVPQQGILSPTHTTSMDIAGMQSSTTPLQDGDFIISKNGWIAGYVKTGVNETVYYLVNVGGLECNVAGTDEIPYKIYR